MTASSNPNARPRMKRRSLQSRTGQQVANALRNPWAIAISAALGIYIGTLNRPLAEFIAPLGAVYLGLLKMCVLPILLSAITMSIGRLMRTQNAGESVRRILLIFPLSLVAVSLLATGIAAIAGPGRDLPATTLTALGGLINQSGIDLEVALNQSQVTVEPTGVSQLFTSLVPDNIFQALSEGQTLKVLVFSIIFGSALGLVQEEVTETFFSWLESVYKTCNKLLQGLTLLLPFGLCSLIASQFAKIGVEVLLAMLKFVIVASCTYGLIYGISTLILWRQSDRTLWQVIIAQKETTILAIATTSSLTCIPAAIAALGEDLQFNRQATNLVTPLSITLCRFGSVIYFALAAVFVMQLYGKPFTLESGCMIVVGSILAGMATSGVTGILTLTLLDLVLSPLKLPLEAVLVLFIAIDPLMDPLRTVSIVQTGMAVTGMIVDRAATTDPYAQAFQSQGNFIDNIARPERSQAQE
jgi:proton glutamate symport protein